MAYITIKARVPQEVADAIRKGKMNVGNISRDLSDILKGDYSQLFSQAGVVDIQPADNGAVHTQEQWIALYNAQEGEFKGKRMISAPDGYRIGQNGVPKLVESVRDDFKKSWLVSSTRTIYNPDTLDARIVHNYRSKIVQPTKRRVVVPVYQDKPLPKVLAEEDGLAYLRAYFNTTDSLDEIAKTLVALSGNKVDDICVWTPDQKSRASYQERAAGFEFNGGRFHVNGGNWVGDDDGHSRGVSVKSAKPTRKNRG